MFVGLTADTSYHSKDDERDEQNETLVITLANCIRDTDHPSGQHLQKDIRTWLSPPDPSKNHNIARRAQYDGTAEWFTQCSTFHPFSSSYHHHSLRKSGPLLTVAQSNRWRLHSPHLLFTCLVLGITKPPSTLTKYSTLSTTWSGF